MFACLSKRFLLPASTPSRPFWLLLWVLFAGLSCGFAQTGTDYFAKYQDYSNRTKYDSALAVSEKASHFFLNQKDTLNYVYTKHVLPLYVFMKQSDFYKAHVELQEMAETIIALGKGEDGFMNYLYFHSMGTVYLTQDDFKNAIYHLQIAVSYAERLYDENSITMANLYLDLANAHNRSGEYEAALKELGVAEKVYLVLHDTLSYANVLVNKSNTYTLTEDYALAIQVCERAKALIAHHRPDVLPVVLPSIYNNIGVAYLYWNKHAEAVGYFKRALQAQIDPTSESSDVARIWFNMGYSYLYLDSLEQSERCEQTAQAMLGKRGLTNDALLSWSYNLSSKGMLKRKRYQEAMQYAQYALYQNASGHGRMVNNLYEPYYQVKDVVHNPKEANCVDHHRLLESIILKIDILQQQNQKGDETAYIRQFLAEADTLATLSRDYYSSDKDKVEMMKNAFDLSDRAITFYFDEQAKRPARANVLSAIAFSEKAKASVLLDVIRSAEAKSFTGVPAEVVLEGDSLKEQVTSLKNSLKGKSEEEKQKILRQMYEAQRYFGRYQALVKSRYPTFYDLKYGDGHTDISALQQSLQPGTAVLSYFLGDSALRVFVIEKHRLDMYQRNVPAHLVKLCKGLRTSILYKNDEFFQQASHELYQYLFFFPLSKDIHDLVIIPHDYLNHIPFEVLLTQEGGGKEIGQLEYLVKKYNVSYSYSIGLYDRMGRRASHSTKKHFLGIAPVFRSKNKVSGDLKRSLMAMNENSEEGNVSGDLTRTISEDAITPIPGTQEEVTHIKNLFEQQHLSSQVLLNEQANEQSIKMNNLNDYRFVHIATHGFVDHRNPENSGIILQQDTSTQEDNILYAKEMYNLNLKADMVVLSACETGLGQIKKGEGLIGLTRPLLYAGAKNIVVSLWKVSDASTSQLMTDFYRHITLKRNLAESLSAAKRTLIQGGTYAHPYYWAPFVLIGR